jgi:iron(III) transport system permease protein
MSATFNSAHGRTYAMIIQSMVQDEGMSYTNLNASGRRCASTVFIMIVSGLILYLVYGVGARDLSERLVSREKRKQLARKLKGLFAKKEKVHDP